MRSTAKPLIRDPWFHARFGVSLALTCGIVAGCSSAAEPEAVDTQSSSPYADDIRAAGEQATSEFERSVLEDGVIEEAEYEEAVGLFLACMDDYGVDVTKVRQGAYYIYQTADSEGFDTGQVECSPGTKGLIEGLYVETVANPEKGDQSTVRAECLVKSGIAPEGYDAADFDRDKRGESAVVDVDSPEFSTCMTDPEAFG